MRLLTDHIVSNDQAVQLQIEVLDEPGQGGACHLYQITGMNTQSNQSDPFIARYGAPATHATVLFQNGPIKEAGANGITNEALLAIVIDRLRSFQSGPYACKANADALAVLRVGLKFLKERTVTRIERGVEGTPQI